MKRARALKVPRTLLNIKVSPSERMMIRDAACAHGLSVAEFLRKVLRAEAKKILQAQMEKEDHSGEVHPS